MKKIIVTTTLLSALALTGCAVDQQSCDATKTDPSMWEKLNCDTRGGYRQQITRNEKALVDAREENKLFHEVYEEIAAQQKATQADLETQQRQQAKLSKSLNSLLSQVKAKHANKASAQQQIAELEAQIKKTQNKAVSNNPAAVAAKRKELEDLQRKVSRLQLSLGYE